MRLVLSRWVGVETFCLCVCLVVTGCDSLGKSQSSSVAIIDLDEVAKQLGSDAAMVSAIEQRQASLNEQVASVKSSLESQLLKQKASFGEAPTAEQSRQLVKLQNDANLKLNQLRQQAQTNATQFQQAVVNQFREEAKPIAKQIAAERGCNVVLTRNDTVIFTFDDAIDITDETINRMSANRLPTKTAATPPSASTTTR